MHIKLYKPNRIAIALVICIIAAGAALAAEDTWKGVERIVAIGDLHGDFDQFVALLRSSGLVNNKNKWSGGKAHLVQIGDVPDRGSATRRIMDLLMDLEKQAQRAGGAVHAMIGNHEAMNVYGDLRYVTPEEYASFRDANSEQVRDAFYRRHLEQLMGDPSRPRQAPPPDEAYRREWEAKYPLGYFEHRFQFGPNGKYGKWIASHNAIIQINDTIFVHGGISPKYADIAPQVINERIREELKDFSKLEGGIARDPEGPLWYRGLAQEEEAVLAAHVENLLKLREARRIAIGHTPTAGAILPRFGGRVLMIDVGISAAYGANQACLILEGGKAYALHRGKRLEIPSDAGEPVLTYLKRAAGLDPAPSPPPKLIEQMAASPSAVR